MGVGGVMGDEDKWHIRQVFYIFFGKLFIIGRGEK